MFTAQEGRTTYEILDRLEKTEGLEGALTERPPEGSLLPETYSFALGDTRDAIVKRMRHGDGEGAQRTLGEACARPALQDQAGGGHPRVHHRERDGARKASAPAWHRCSSTACAKACGCSRPDGHLRITKGKGRLGRRLFDQGPGAQDPPTTPTASTGCSRPDRQPGRAAIAAALNPYENEGPLFCRRRYRRPCLRPDPEGAQQERPALARASPEREAEAKKKKEEEPRSPRAAAQTELVRAAGCRSNAAPETMPSDPGAPPEQVAKDRRTLELDHPPVCAVGCLGRFQNLPRGFAERQAPGLSKLSAASFFGNTRLKGSVIRNGSPAAKPRQQVHRERKAMRPDCVESAADDARGRSASISKGM